MRLKKADKEKHKQTIKDSKEKKVISLGAAQDVKWAWQVLKWDHFNKLRLDLDHIGNYPVIDELEADCIDGETLFNTKCYLKHYTDWELERILKVELRRARNGIDYLEKLAREEQESRNSGRNSNNRNVNSRP